MTGKTNCLKLEVEKEDPGVMWTHLVQNSRLSLNICLLFRVGHKKNGGTLANQLLGFIGFLLMEILLRTQDISLYFQR